ncbi:MAG: hypothetical protein ACT4P7_17205 [Gemmatimonadaceae bacterium]
MLRTAMRDVARRIEGRPGIEVAARAGFEPIFASSGAALADRRTRLRICETDAHPSPSTHGIGHTCRA